MGVNDITKTLKNEMSTIHRTTVTSNCKELVSLGLIRKKNKQAKYELTGLAGTEPMLFRRIYKTKTHNNIWRIKPPLFRYQSDGNTLKINKFLDYDHTEFSSFIITKNRDEIELYKFVQKIGTIITYLLLYAIQPYSNSLQLSKSAVKNTSLLKKLSGFEKDYTILQWITQVIDPIQIFHEFSKLNVINRVQPRNRINSKASMFEVIDEEKFNNVLNIFQNIFPNIYHELEKHIDIQERDSRAYMEAYYQWLKEQRNKEQNRKSL